MNMFKKFIVLCISIVFVLSSALVVVNALPIIGSEWGHHSITHTGSNKLENKTYNDSYGQGILSCSINTTLIDEAALRTKHSALPHKGSLTTSYGYKYTNYTITGSWSNQIEIRISYGSTAWYYGYYA